MKKTTIIITILLLGTNLFSQEGGNNTVIDKNTFTANELSRFEIKGFENHAIQKIEEYASYIQIISNKSYDSKLRKQAIILAKNLFNNKNISFKNIDTEITKKHEIYIDELLSSIYGSNFSKISVNVSNFIVSEELKPYENHFKGKITFTKTNTYYKNNKLISESKSLNEIEIFLIKTEKTFGNEKNIVWNVFLGEIISLER